VLRPDRSPGGFRLYDAADEARIRRVLRLMRDGLSAGEAARLVVRDEEDGATRPPPDERLLQDLGRRLDEGLDAFDEGSAHRALDELLGAFTVETVLRDVCIPYLRRLGERWEAGTTTVGQEHFASGVLRGRLLGLARGWGAGRGPSAILACPPGELHEIGLMMFGIVLSRRGWRVTYLGADTPFGSTSDAARSLTPALVALATSDADALSRHASDIRSLAADVPVVIGGSGATPDVVRALGARPLEDDPVSAAERIADAHPPARPFDRPVR
jgi:methanogenic corrinoid protein MtbC1